MLVTVQAGDTSWEDSELCLSQVLITSEDGATTNGGDFSQKTGDDLLSLCKDHKQGQYREPTVLGSQGAPVVQALPAEVLCPAR